MLKGMRTGIKALDILWLITPVCRGLHRTSCKLAEGARPVFAGPPLDYRRWTKIGFSLQLPEAVPGLRRFSPSSRKQATLDEHIVCRYYLSSTNIRSLWVSVQASIFLVLLCTSERLGSFSTGSSTGPHSTSSPRSCPTKDPLRSFQQEDVQPSLVHPATKPHLLDTNALRCAICLLYTSPSPRD